MSRRRAFTAKEKLAVIAYAEEHGNRAAERHFDISECNVRRWRKDKLKLVQTRPGKKCDRRGRVKYPGSLFIPVGKMFQVEFNSLV